METNQTSPSKSQKKVDIIPTIPTSNKKAKFIFPDGKEYEFPVLEPTLGPPVIDIRTLLTTTGYFTFDPAFFSTASCPSRITFIDGDKGELYYRGYDIHDLVKYSSHVEVCYLLMYGALPSSVELQKFQDVVIKEMIIHEKIVGFYKGFKDNAHPMAILTGVVGALSGFMHDDLDIRSPSDRELAAIRIIAKLPTIAAIASRVSNGLPIVYPKKEYGYVENFLYMMLSDPMKNWKVDPEILKAFETIFILHADHEQGPSTTTIRIAGSSQANPYACVASAITSLWGPSHGGADEAVLSMLEEIGSVEKVDDFIKEHKEKKTKIVGFGHRIYKTADPRGKIMEETCKQLIKKIGKKEPLLEIADKLNEIVSKDEYFIKRNLHFNMDFYTGLIYKAIGIPKNMFTVIFSVARSIGWITNWMEMMATSADKIGRPRQLYVGHTVRPYVDVDDRKVEEKSRVPDSTGRVGDILQSIKLN